MSHTYNKVIKYFWAAVDSQSCNLYQYAINFFIFMRMFILKNDFTEFNLIVDFPLMEIVPTLLFWAHINS